MAVIRLAERLASSRVEKDVENAYRAEIAQARPDAVIDSPHNTDGYARWGNVRLLLEAKYDQHLKDRVPLCSTLGQLLLYLKRFEAAGEALPNVLLVGDRNECFVLATSAVENFLRLQIDWSVAPSIGSPPLTRALVEGLNLLPYVYDVDGAFDFRGVLARCDTLAAGERHTVRATPGNLGAIFVYWVDRVFQDKELSPTEQVDVFLRCLFQPSEVYLHPHKRGLLLVPGYAKGVVVNADQYRSFFDHFCQGYKPSEVETFYGMKDQLVEDDARRRQGAFFTPRLWVDEAHKELDRVLGSGWRETCVVWDPAAGTANLTRDYLDWGCLISSTCERADVAVMREQGWGGHHVFQYDFLNPASGSLFIAEEENRVPSQTAEGLHQAAMAGKRLVFLMNPPYGTANNAGTEEGDHKAGIALTATNAEMKREKLGACSQQLYAQFMYRCVVVAREYGFKNWVVAAFSIPTFMCSGSYRPFREWWYTRHAFQGGFLFQASHFADVSGRWGIAFTLWASGGTTARASDLLLALKDEANFAVVQIGEKRAYSSDDREASAWVREPIKGLRGEDAPQMSSGLVVSQKGQSLVLPESLGFIMLKGNNVMENSTGVTWVSAGYTNGHGFSPRKENWRRAVALFAARKLVPEDWINQKDEYLAPDTTLPGYEQWVDDAHIYALLHPSNNCTAMRDVPYKGKPWRIKNHWFWRTRASALVALDTPETPALYRDCKAETAGDAYFAQALPALNLSVEARAVLNLLDALWVKSLSLRESYAAGRPDLHLLAHDAGVYQLKHLWRELYPEDWAQLQDAYRGLVEKLKTGVYTYGFLMTHYARHSFRKIESEKHVQCQLYAAEGVYAELRIEKAPVSQDVQEPDLEKQHRVDFYYGITRSMPETESLSAKINGTHLWSVSRCSAFLENAEEETRAFFEREVNA